MEEFKAVSDYNSFVMGIHNYYRMATAASPDIQRLAFEIKISIKNRLQERVRRRSNQTIPEYAKRYARSREIRFIGKNILLPIGYIQHHPPIHKKKSVNKYTAAGRAEIHKNLECVDMSILHSLMKNPLRAPQWSITITVYPSMWRSKENVPLRKSSCPLKKSIATTKSLSRWAVGTITQT